MDEVLKIMRHVYKNRGVSQNEGKSSLPTALGVILGVLARE
jgi:hypothetical protein